MNDSRLKSVIIAIIIAIVAVTGAVAYHGHNQSPATSDQTITEQRTIEYSGEDGKTALDILKSKYTVEASTSSFGVMVNSINGLKSTDKEFWLYSVNGQMPDVGADQYVTKSTDQVKWEYKN